MFQTELSSTTPGPDQASDAGARDDGRTDVVGVVPLVWEEHCTECAFPTCYSTCALYRRRTDGHCARFADGIAPVRSGPGGAPTGGRMRFLRWAKLEATLSPAPLMASPARLTTAAKLDVAAGRRLRRLAPASQQARVAVRYGALRRDAVTRLGRSADRPPDALDLEVLSTATAPFRLVIEATGSGRTARTAVTLRPGENLARVPAAELGIGTGWWPQRLMVLPEGDLEVELTFRRLELVWLDHGAPPAAPTVAAGAPAPTVKVVVWDLDGTVWDGVLAEDGIEGLRLRDGVVEVMRGLDERGVLQSVASKNDPLAGMAALEHFGIAELVLAPQLGWGAKSAAIRRIAEALDLGVDTICFVDDSAAERAEVAASLEGVRVVDAADTSSVVTLLDRPELDVPVTPEARARREMYRVAAQRRADQLDIGEDHDAFLRRCELRAELFTPRPGDERARCVELLQRTNQLNLTTRRRSAEELDALVQDASTTVLAADVEDRYGRYGIVALVVVDRSGPVPLLTDLVTSCRVAGKAVEAALLGALARALTADATPVLRAVFRPTARNHVLRAVLDDIGFRAASPPAELPVEPGDELLELPLGRPIPRSDLVAVHERD